MLKFSIFVALFLCFVYSNAEHNVDTEFPENEVLLPNKQSKDNKNTFQTIEGHYIEERKRKKPCKQNNKRRFDDQDDTDSELFDSLPLTATTEQRNSTRIGDKIVTSSIHGANYNYDNEKTDTETVNRDLNSKNCECNDCILEANKKVLHFEALALGRNSNSFNDAAIEASESEPSDSTSIPFNNTPRDESDSDDRDNDSPLKINTGARRKLCNKGLNTNTRRRKCKTIDSVPTTRRILPGVIENPTDKELKDNRLYQDSPQINPNDNEMENRKNILPNLQKVSNSYDIDLVRNININEASQPSTSEEDTVERKLYEPTRGKGIFAMKDAKVMLLENFRICYACSTLSDITCWGPNQNTPVKYCPKGQTSCLTRSFNYGGASAVVRDCGNSCDSWLNVKDPNTSCSICQSDLCNGASTAKIYTTGIAIIVFFGILLNTQ